MINVGKYTSPIDPMGMTFVDCIPFFFVGSDTMRWTQIEVWWYLVSTWAVFSYFTFPFCRFQCLMERLLFWKDMTCHISILLRTQYSIFVLLHGTRVPETDGWIQRWKRDQPHQEIMFFDASEPAKWLNPTVFHMFLVRQFKNILIDPGSSLHPQTHGLEIATPLGGIGLGRRHHWFQRSMHVFECNMQQSTMIIPNFYDNLSWQSHDEPTYAIWYR